MILKIGEVEIELYDGIKHLPYIRKGVADVYMLWSEGVGSEIDKVRQSLAEAITFLTHQRNQDAAFLIQNAEFAIECAKVGEDWQILEFVAFIKRIGDDVLPLRLDRDNMQPYVDKLYEMAITVGEVEDTLDDIKKKLKAELERYFPERHKSVDPNSNSTLKKYEILRADLLISPDQPEKAKEKDRLYKLILERNAPYCFNPSDENNIITKMELSAAELLLSLQESGLRGETLTVFEVEVALRKNEREMRQLKVKGNAVE